MIRPYARHALMLTAAALAPGPQLAAQNPGGFSLPPASPSPTPAPAGPADERAGVAIPPRTAPPPTATATPTATPVIPSLPPARPSATRGGSRPEQPAQQSSARTATPPAATTPLVTPGASGDTPAGVPVPSATPPTSLPSALPAVLPPAGDAPLPGAATAPLPAWWPYAAGGTGALALLGGAALAWRRRKPKQARLAVLPAAGGAAPDAPDLARLDCTLEIITATRSVMMFTLGYRLTIANRSPRALTGLGAAVELACAWAGKGGGTVATGTLDRIGPHQAAAITGEVSLPLSAVRPFAQGRVPLFVPLVYAALSAEGAATVTRSFVVGPRSAGGRVHPIPLDQTPGGMAGLVAQAIIVPPLAAAAA